MLYLKSSGTIDTFFFSYCFAEDMMPCELHHFCLYLFLHVGCMAWYCMSVMHLQFCFFFVLFVHCFCPVLRSTGDLKNFLLL